MDKPLVIVSGLPRSGTSMMMRMLEQGGIPLVMDGVRQPDEDNPRGYFEEERIKKLKDDSAWVGPHLGGQALKAVSALLYYLPAGLPYRVIFMEREMHQVLASQRKMLLRRGQDPDAVDDATMALKFEEHLRRVRAWLAEQANMPCLYLWYHEVVRDARAAALQVAGFLGPELAPDPAAMAAAVDGELFRNR